jgi:hypothetical protein
VHASVARNVIGVPIEPMCVVTIGAFRTIVERHARRSASHPRVPGEGARVIAVRDIDANTALALALALAAIGAESPVSGRLGLGDEWARDAGEAVGHFAKLLCGYGRQDRGCPQSSDQL